MILGEGGCLEQLQAYDNCWGVGVRRKDGKKVPVYPRQWKKSPHMLGSYDEMVKRRDAKRAKGEDAMLYFALYRTKIRVLDIDLIDKIKKLLRPDQTMVLDHYRKKVIAPIERSQSGDGSHIYLLDDEDKLPAVGDRLVKSGKMPCEIKDGIVYVTGDFEDDSVPMPRVDPFIINLVQKSRLQDTTLKARKADRHPGLLHVLAAMDWMVANDFDCMPEDYHGWGGFYRGLVSLGATAAEVEERSKTSDKFDKANDPETIANAKPFDNPPPNDQYFILLSNLRKRGFDDTADLTDFGYTAPEKEKKTKTTYGEIKVVDSGRPIIDYGECLERIGVRIRDHAYKGFQCSDDGKTWESYRTGILTSIYDRVLREVTMIKGKEEDVPRFYKDARREAIDLHLYRNRYNPLVDYLDSLADVKPDKNVRFLLGKLFAFNIADSIVEELSLTPKDISIYYADLLMLLVKGIVARARQPGANFPFFFLFKGTRGCGKSFFVERLLPESARSGFADSFDMSLPAKEKDFLLRSAALVECSEMMGHTKRAIADHKSLISSKSTRHRVPYQPFPEEIIRNAIMVGTSNEEECLPSVPDGDRRHAIAPVAFLEGWGEPDVEEKLPKIMDEYRDQLFALALKEYAERPECSVGKWSDTSRKILNRLSETTEKRHMSIELAIRHLVNPAQDRDSKFIGKYLSADQKAQGLPLAVPEDCETESIMDMLVANAKLYPGVPVSMTAHWVAMHLRKMGWVNLDRHRVKTSRGDARVTFYKPPDVSEWVRK